MPKWIVVALMLIAVSACSSGGGHKAAPTTSSGSTAVSTPGTVPATTAPASTASTTGSPAAGPCTGSAPPAAYRHVAIIVMENRALEDVNGSDAAPYVTSLGKQCGAATGYSGVTHPSLPNYIALTSGSTYGISDDAGPSSHPVAGPSIFSLLGTGWRSIQESMPTPCDHSSSGDYATKHNPAVYYTGIAGACATQDVPLADDQAPDVSARYTLITPNQCNDGHNCSTATADHWLSVEVPLILHSAEYRAGDTVLFIIWDENDSGGTLVPTYVVAPSVPPGTVASAAFNHYSLLRTSEELLGLTPLLGNAATAPSMRGAFHL